MERKAFGLIDLKAKDDTGTFSGRASVYGVVDSYGDVVMPGAFTETLTELGNKCVVLNQHSPYDSIGMALLEDAADGLHVKEGVLELELQSAREAYTRVKKGLVTGISIGYETKEETFERGIRQLRKIKLWEVSLVTFPANTHARVTGVKNYEDPLEVMRDAMREFKRLSSLLVEEKAGRILSAANLALVKDCHTAGAAMCDKLSALIKVAEGAEDEEEAAKAAAKAAETKTALEEISAFFGGLKL